MRNLIFLSLLLLAACKTEYPGQEPAPNDPDAAIPVKFIVAEPTTEPIPVVAGGTVGSKEEARLSFKIGGVVEAVYAKEGQYVKRGQTLARLRTNEIDARVAKAERAREKLSRDLERTKILYAEEAATLENVQDLETALQVAASDLEIAEFNQRYATITAPVSGRVVRKMAERGELVGPGAPVYFLVGEGRRSYVLRVGVADRAVLQLAAGDRASVALDAYPGSSVPATVSQIAAAADPRTGTFGVELSLEPGELKIRNGFVGRADIFPSGQAAHYRLPIDALVEGEGRRVRLFLLEDDNTVRAHQATSLGLYEDNFLLPANALPTGTRVVTSGAAYLTEGRKVQPEAQND